MTPKIAEIEEFVISKKYNINVQVNLNALRGELQRALQRTTYLVASGLQTKNHIDVDKLRLPTTSIDMKFADGLSWNTEQSQEHYSEWVLSNGFRDMIESTNAFLDSAHKILSFWELASKKKDRSEITGADWNKLIVAGNQKFHSFGLPDKLTHIKNDHEIAFDEKLSDFLVSINKARNCLVHRSGIVSQRDLTKDKVLEVKWRRMIFIVEKENEEKELILGEVVQKGSTITMRHQDESKSFSIGSHVKFSAQEFANISWCLFLFGNDLVQKINDYGIKNGFVVKEAKDSA